MAWTYPATGETITFKVKKSTAANGGRMKGDAQLIEMLDIMLPVAELKTMMSDEVDAWIAKMAEYGQEWCEPDGRLLKCTDYPELFALIGYNYGWSSTNPNGTSTYSFTDNNGASKSLVIYNDLDIDGNALPVVGTPAYFRIPNLAGRFLRCAGTASYVNKWTDTDGTVRQLLTEYKAEMYKGQLDAQRGISGDFELLTQTPQSQTGVFSKLEYIQDIAAGFVPGNPGVFIRGWGRVWPKLNSALVTPNATENLVITGAVSVLIRVC